MSDPAKTIYADRVSPDRDQRTIGEIAMELQAETDAEQRWSFRDRSLWAKGPWDGELADKVQWIDAATGLDCLLHRNRMGAWCGYVGVPPGHSLHGVEGWDKNLSVHGGISFSDFCDPSGEEGGEGICHIAAPGRPEAVWWLGFDCSHCDDLLPHLNYHMTGHQQVYRDEAYAKRWCVKLASQLIEMEGGAK